MKIASKTKKQGQDDPRRIVRSLKVGLAVSLVLLLYYFYPLYDGFGQEGALWVVLTVVLAFEISVGATLGKGLNRMLATLVAGALGVGAHCSSTLSGRKGKPILVATFVFIIDVITTFMRFIPTVKARYPYGHLIFILTFCLVSISSYRDDQVLEMAHDRFLAIIVGCCVSLIVCMCLFPFWIGEDLHKSVSANMEKLSNFLQDFIKTAFGDEYFTEKSNEKNKSYLQGYTSVLTSKSSEETMANFARWERGHGPFRYRHPWKMYLKVGNLTRDCAYKVEALNSHLNCKIQKSVAKSKSHAKGSANTHIESSKKAAEDLKSLLKTNLWEEADLLQIIPAASVTSPLLEIIECVEKIAEAVNELGNAASFRQSNVTVLSEQPHSIHQESIQQGSNTALPVPHCVITVAE
ncbi:aluminum-activated malate transporter 2-like [Hibiscus syriacus]|uniref:aluminum-activated malate transporter 2-like n=1 Tax=Hibiscus syriacus TaxID=106335 RepID=UPI0019209E20|nr:aluminum-activated malate transporter 2-like [Hibiscus syriacus]